MEEVTPLAVFLYVDAKQGSDGDLGTTPPSRKQANELSMKIDNI